MLLWLQEDPKCVFYIPAEFRTKTAGLSKAISDYMESMTVRVRQETGQGFQCLVCSSFQRQFINMRKHMLAKHHFGNNAILQQLEEATQPYYIDQGQGTYTCLLCRKILKKQSRATLMIHFLSIHMS